MASLAQLERRVTGERTRSVLAAKRERGEKTGGSVPLGYVVDSEGRLHPHAQEQRIVERVVELRRQRVSLRNIVDTLAAEGITNRVGTPFVKRQIERILAREAARCPLAQQRN